MSRIKDLIIREEEAMTAIVSRRVGRVSVGGGSIMGGMMAVLASLEQEAAEAGMTLEQFALAEETKVNATEDLASGVLLVADQADKELDRQEAADPSAPVAVLAPVVPIQYFKGGLRYTLIVNGACTHCAHCGMTLTDPTSQEAGLGPVCRSRGYNDDPVAESDSDSMQALIDLAEYPVLVDYLTTNYKDKGKHKLMVGLVKIASLNRRTPVHQAVTDAIESLGYKRLASTLRESLCCVEIKEHDPLHFNIWIKKSEWHWSFANDIRHNIPNAYTSRQFKGTIVPKSDKKMLWSLCLKHYSGFFAKVPDGAGGKKAVKIQAKTMTPPPSDPHMT